MHHPYLGEAENVGLWMQTPNAFKTKFKREPQNYSITAYNGVLVIADAIDRVAKSGKPVEKGYLYRIITNPVYVGEARHKGTSYPGEHKAIVDRKLWDRVQAILKESPRKRAASSREVPAGTPGH